MQSIGDAPAYYKRAKRLHRAAYHRSTRLTPERKARFVAESITLKRDEGRPWSWADYGTGSEHPPCKRWCSPRWRICNMEGLGEETITTFTQAVKRTFDIAMARSAQRTARRISNVPTRSSCIATSSPRTTASTPRCSRPMASAGIRSTATARAWTRRAPRKGCVNTAWRLACTVAPASCSPRPRAAASPRRRRRPLPEAPASVNVRLCVDGHECQFTMRDADEARLVERLQALLARFPQAAKAAKSEASAPPAQTTGETPLCPVHGPGKESSKAPGTFVLPQKTVRWFVLHLEIPREITRRGADRSPFPHGDDK